MLEDPIQYPEHLPSPYSALHWQGGDCFDFATVLVSLLTGVGYDAYAVMGYAPKWVTHMDQTLTQVCDFSAYRVFLTGDLGYSGSGGG